MIERYTLKEMGEIWTEKNKFRTWLKVEIAVCEAQAELGYIPPAAVEIIKKKANFDINRILEIEEEVKHDVVAFLTNVAEYVGEESRYIHLGMTSSDLLDTSNALLLKQAGEKLLKRTDTLISKIKNKALEHKNTPMAGRTHGVHSEPITFGLKMALWYEEMKRNRDRIARAIDSISVGKISGSVGTYAHIDPKIEKISCKKLGIKAANVSSQIIQRDRHAEFLNSLALTGASLEKFAIEIRHLQKTEVMELEEYFSKGQKGSSSMPHKRNPIICERISGLARLLRTNALASIENIALWHERDISHSSVERVIFPDSTIILDYILSKFTNIMENLVVNTENMKNNIFMTRGLFASQPLLLELTKKGMLREDAYKIIQSKAMESWSLKKDFKEIVKNERKITEKLNQNEIEECFKPETFLKHINFIFKEVGLIN